MIRGKTAWFCWLCAGLLALGGLLRGQAEEPSAGIRPLTDWLSEPGVQSRLDQMTWSRETLNEVELLHLGQRSLPVREDLIRKARNFIFMSVPYWHGDEAGWYYLSLLEDKRREIPGLDMRLIQGFASMDMLAHFLPTAKFRALERVFARQVLQWNTFWWLRGFSWNILKYRLHDKMLLVDGTDLVLGGLNVGNHYFYGGRAPFGWHDTDVHIHGPAAREATLLFLKNWVFMQWLSTSNYFPPFRKDWVPMVQEFYRGDRSLWTFQGIPLGRIPERPPFRRKRWVHLPLDAYTQSKIYFPDLPKPSARAVPVRLIYDNPFVDREPARPYTPYSKTQRVLRMLLAHARSRVLLFVPYFTVNRELIEALQSTARRGVRVALITNSFSSLDNPRLYYGSLPHYLPLLRAGISVYEWLGHPHLNRYLQAHGLELDKWPGHTMHTKAVVLDGEVLVIGSHNMNVRSDHYNTEVMAMIRSPRVAGEMEEIFERDLRPLVITDVDGTGRPVFHQVPKVRLMDEAALREALDKYGPEVRVYRWLMKLL